MNTCYIIDHSVCGFLMICYYRGEGSSSFFFFFWGEAGYLSGLFAVLSYFYLYEICVQWTVIVSIENAPCHHRCFYYVRNLKNSEKKGRNKFQNDETRSLETSQNPNAAMLFMNTKLYSHDFILLALQTTVYNSQPNCFIIKFFFII